MKTNKVMYCKREDCPRHSAMTPHEYAAHWLFVCPTCGSAQLWDKTRPEIGGTLGAGSRGDGCRPTIGKGF